MSCSERFFVNRLGRKFADSSARVDRFHEIHYSPPPLRSNQRGDLYDEGIYELIRARPAKIQRSNCRASTMFTGTISIATAIMESQLA